MNILIWSNQFSIGGGMRLLFNLTSAIARQPGVERVRLVVAPNSQLRNYVELQKTGNIEICYNTYPINHPQCSHLLANMNVVYFFWPHTEQFQAIDRPTVCTFHDTTIFDFVPPFMKGDELSFHWRLSKKWIDHTSSVVVSSQHVKNRLIAHFGSRSEQAYVIPHAITPIANVYNRKVSPELGARIPSDYIIYPSNTSPHKNHNNLLMGFAKSRYKRKYPLVLTGYLTDKMRIPFPDSTSEVNWIPTLVSTMKRTGLLMDRQVYPLGFVSDQDIPALIKNAKALIMPSLSEGGGSYPVEEALRLGTPVLCSDIPVMREHLSRHSAKIAWFDPHNPDSIAKALNEFFDDYDTYKMSALHGVHDPTQTWDDIARQYIEVFRITFWRYYGKVLY